MGRPTSDTGSTTVRRLLALQEGQRRLTREVTTMRKEVTGVNARLDVLTGYVAAQGRTLETLVGHVSAQGQTLDAIKTLLERTLALGPKLDALEHRVTGLETRSGR
jgi:uncharacterized coiled-coil protein SlyX